MTLWALHGFLGQASDWDFLREPLAAKGVKLEAVDLYSRENSHCRAFWDWAEKFNRRVSRKPGPHYLLGYSLGGRLALHALLENPKLWKGGAVVSAHPGLVDRADRIMRAKRDLAWVDQFLHDPWSDVIASWNAQTVFAGSFDRSRGEKDFSREEVARMMKTWSLARQGDLRPYLRRLPIPVLWAVGQADGKFRDLAKQAQGENENIQVAVVDEAGHRVPWDQPERFLHLLEGLF